MTIQITIPSDNKPLAAAIGRALTEYGEGATTGRISGKVVNISNGPRDEYIDSRVAEIEREVHLGELNNELDPEGGDCPNENRVDTATTQDGSMETQTSDVAGVTGVKVDEKGVLFIPAVFGNAAIPFYASGARKGQWKKLRGVTDQEYDRVYAGELAKVATTGAGQQQSATTEQTAQEVFGGQGQQQQSNLQQTNPAATPQQVFELYSGLVQQGKADPANGIMQKHGLANGSLIYSRPDLAAVILPELQAL